MSIERKLLGLLADVVPTGSRLSDAIELKVSTLRTLLRDAAEIGAEDEREECLAIAEKVADAYPRPLAGTQIAAAIRARGGK